MCPAFFALTIKGQPFEKSKTRPDGSDGGHADSYEKEGKRSLPSVVAYKVKM